MLNPPYHYIHHLIGSMSQPITPGRGIMVPTTWVALIALFCFCVTVSSEPERQTYIVHIDKTKTGSPQWHQSIIDTITQLSSSSDEEEEEAEARPELLYIYETALSGFAAKLSPKHLDSLTEIDGFLSVTKDDLLSLHTTHSPHFLGLSDGEGLWAPQNLASDIIIGVLDTGIWPEHVSFHDSGFSKIPSRWKGACEGGTRFSTTNCNKKLIGARVFFKGYEAVAGRINETTEFRSARDNQGHGTHTASTAGGNVVKKADLLGFAKGSATGMRYSSRIAAYKVCWQFGCASSDILAAMDQAVSDGVDVMSLSLGGSTKPYFMDNIAIAGFGAVAKGVFVTCSAGNSGPTPTSVSNTAPWIMTVAANYIDRSFPTKVKLGNGLIFEGSSLYSGSGTKLLPLAYNTSTSGNNGARYCLLNSLDSSLVRGRIVICDRGINSRAGKGEEVKRAGGAGMLLLNSDADGEELIANAYTLPAATVGALAAGAIRKYVNSSSNRAKASISFRGTVYGTTAPILAAFSSRGPSLFGPDVIKPDITAPGVNILAAWPPNIGPTLLKTDNRTVLFNIISGTSMSCPHVSGLAALLKSVHRDWSAAAIKSALMTTAYVLDNRRSPITDVASGLATPFGFGSGHVDPERAADPGLVYDISSEDYLQYLCSLNYSASQVALFEKSKPYSCPKVKNAAFQPGDLNYPSFAVLFNKTGGELGFTYTRTVTNVGAGRISYHVQVVEPERVKVIVKPRILSFVKVGEKLSYRVSFLASKNGKVPWTNSSFGSITWVSGRYTVRSPIAVTWV